MGPNAHKYQFVKVESKYKDRARAVSDQHTTARTSAQLYNTRVLPVVGYITQLAIPPEAFLRCERQTVTTLLHMPTNSLDENAVFNLHIANGSKIRSMKALAIASLVRTAIKTVPDWATDVAVLNALPDDEVACSSLGSNSYRRCIWDHPPFACVLQAAARGFTSTSVDPLHLDARTFLVKRTMQINKAVKNALAILSRHPMRLKTAQSIVYDFVQKELYPSRLQEFLARRIEEVFPTLVPDASGIRWAPIFHALERTDQHAAMFAMKTWTNSWTTSTRHHDGKAKFCILGCRGTALAACKDDLEHYILCPRLWVEVDIAGGGPEDPIDHPLPRLLINDINKYRIRALVVAYTTYHEIKRGHVDLIHAAEADVSYSVVLTAIRVAALAFATKFA